MYVHPPQRSPMPTQAIRLPIGFDIPIALSHALLFSEGHHTFAATTGFSGAAVGRGRHAPYPDTDGYRGFKLSHHGDRGRSHEVA